MLKLQNVHNLIGLFVCYCRWSLYTIDPLNSGREIWGCILLLTQVCNDFKPSYLLFCSCANSLSTQTDSVDVIQKMSSVDHSLALRSQQMWCQAIQTTGYSVQSHNRSDTNGWGIEIQNYVSQQCVPRYKLCVHKPYTLTAILDCTATKVKHACASKWFSWYLPMECPNSQIGNSSRANRGMQESSYRNSLPSNVLTLWKFRRN